MMTKMDILARKYLDLTTALVTHEYRLVEEANSRFCHE